MNYYIEKHDMEIILDALELMSNNMKNMKLLGIPNNSPYSETDVDNLFQSFDNSGAEV